ncbi:ribbon-helix-helix domain-containing protein [Sphingomonas sp. LT1P40]|uniref:ribbon-helix-helix domain-containing protein n=1 Tax=Alteristakelama amylovorans TaxID=3096166 RepID=UPI002FC7141A
MTVPVSQPPGGFAGPVKRSITIAGHATSISLEPMFWTALEDAARACDLPLSALVAEIDHLRITTPDPSNLASAIRSWLFAAATNCDKVKMIRNSVDTANDSQ